MIPDKLKDDFNSLRNMFDELKREIDKNVVREENYKGEFYEISPYSYQRNRFKQEKSERAWNLKINSITPFSFMKRNS